MFNGLGTCAHETGECSFSFSGNPYEDFGRLGLDLQNCQIRFLRKPRNNGTAITGVFNISGTPSSPPGGVTMRGWCCASASSGWRSGRGTASGARRSGCSTCSGG